jgi:hypothetical protein
MSNMTKKILALFATAIIFFQPLFAEKVKETAARKIAAKVLAQSSSLSGKFDNANLQSAPVSQQKTQTAATETLPLLYKSSSKGKQSVKQNDVYAANTLQPATVTEPATETDADTVYFYVFGGEDSKGFVIVSGDDRVAPVLGYSDTNSFAADNMPENVKWWLGEYVKQIQFAIDNNIEPTAEVTQQWTDLLGTNTNRKEEQK